jgi:hypothetical protein
MRGAETRANSKVKEPAALRPAHLAGVLGVGLLLRLAVLGLVLGQFSAHWFFSRGMEMGLLAQSIVRGAGLSSPFGPSTGPTAFIAPGYPLIVAAIFALFGVLSPASAVAVMTMQIAFNLLTILLIMRLAAALTSARMALLAGLFWAVSPPLMWLPTIFWDTSLSCCMVAAALVGALRLRRTARAVDFVLAGAFAAVAGLITSALLPTLLALLVWTAYECRKLAPYGLAWALLAFAILFSPWPIRNARVFHAFIPLRTTVGFELWMGNRPQATGFLDESVFPTFNAEELHKYIRMGEVAYVREKSAEARSYILAQPSRFVLLSLRRVVRFWTGSGNLSGSTVFIVHATVTTLLGLCGMVLLFRNHSPAAMAFLIPLVLFPLPYYITHAEFRYRLILDPLLAVLSVYAIDSFHAWWKTR